MAWAFKLHATQTPSSGDAPGPGGRLKTLTDTTFEKA